MPQSDFTLTITMASQLNIKNLLELHSGTKSALIYYLFARHSFPAITGVLALLCGIIIFFASLFIKTELCIRLRHCTNVLLSGVTFLNSPAWNIHPFFCENVTIDNIKVRNPFHQNWINQFYNCHASDSK